MSPSKSAYYLFLGAAVVVALIMVETAKDMVRVLNTETQQLSAHSTRPASRRQKAAPKEQKKGMEIDWSWLRKGARMYEDDGTPVSGGPYVIKERKMPARAAPRGGSKYAPADDAGQRDELFDKAFQLADDHGRDI